MTMSVSAALEPPRPIFACRATPAAPDPGASGDRKLTAARRRVLRALEGGPPRLPAELARESGVGAAVVRGMLDLGWLELVGTKRAPPPTPDGGRNGPTLSADQRRAADSLVDALAGGFSVTLLDGVTGAGKTEVYFEAIAAAVRAGKQALVLLPEIALSAQWLKRFAERFGAAPAEWHSELAASARRNTWRAVAAGHARVLVGARSALFLPFPELGLIVVDEEHESAFKQEDGVVYHARDMAVVRARLTGIPIVLVSATPSLETMVNVELGRYRALHLPDRHGFAALPLIETIDLRRTPPPRRAWLAPPLREALAATLEAGEQAMLFLNRRGYAPLTLCRACGHRLQCPSCTAWLVEHRLAGRLQCHHCGYTSGLPRECPACGAEERFAACGPGVERVAEEATALFPAARIEVITSDTIGGPAAASAFVERMEAREIDLLIGTQIVAKGHHFPALTLVGVVDADLGLAGGDLRASERTYQLLHQVAGRAGREERPGRVLLQTHMPEHPVMQALVSGDRARFLATEAQARRRGGWPPFGRLVAIVVSGADEAEVDRIARRLGKSRPHGGDLQVLGPAPAPLAILRGRHRRRLLLKAARDVQVQRIVRDWLAGVDPPSSVRLHVDVDPYSFV
jgi:primosomal protein N' (replication factor Y)